MSRLRSFALLFLFVLFAARPTPTAASPLPSYTDEETLAYVWKAAEVHFPVSVDAVSALPPYVRNVPVTRGTIRLEPGRSAALWLDALKTVRVRTHDPDSPIKPRFFRVGRRQLGESGWARVLVEEPGVQVDDNSWYLRQLPGKGAPWIISADEIVEIHIEETVPRSGRLVWEHVEDQVVRWIRRDMRDLELDYDVPAIPSVKGSAWVQNRLESDAFLARRTLALDPQAKILRKALEDWRIARAIEAISDIRPLVRPYFATKNLNVDIFGKAEEVYLVPDPNKFPWRRLPEDGAWSFEATGPGVLRLEVRALYPEVDPEVPSQVQPGETPADYKSTQRIELVRDDGHRLASSLDPGTPTLVRELDSSTVFPSRDNLRLNTGERVGHKRTLKVRLAPGKHQYHLRHVRGDAVVRVFQARRLQRMGRAIRGESVPTALRRLRRALERYPGPAAEVLEAMYGTLEPLDYKKDPYFEFTTLDDELLQLTVDILAFVRKARNTKSEESVEAIDLKALALRINRFRLDAPAPFLWWLRRTLADSLVDSPLQHMASEVMTDPGVNASPFALATIASYAEGPDADVPAWSLAGLRAAQRDAPLDSGIRRLFNETWVERTRWAKLVPELTRAVEPWSWVDAAPDPRFPNEAYEAGVLWRIEADRSVSFEAPRADFDEHRAALLRAHVAAPPGVITLSLDGHAYSSLSDSELETFVFATTPGQHQVKVEGPPGTHAFLELAPLDPDLTKRARRVRMWPAVVGGHPLSFKLEGSPTPGVLRIDLRVVHNPDLDPIDPRARIGVTVVPDVGPPTKVFVRPGDPEERDEGGRPLGGIPVDAPGDGGPRLSFRIPTPPMAQRIEIVPDEGAPLMAVSVSVRRHDTIPPPPPEEEARAIEMDAREPSLDAVRRLSERLADVYWDVPARIERAYRLLDLGAIVYARQDLIWLQEADPERTAPWEADIFTLAERISSWTTPTHLAMHASRFATPELLEPALGALVGDDRVRLEPFVTLTGRARRDGPQRGLIGLLEHESGDEAVRTALEARWLFALEEWPESAAKYARLVQHYGVWQAGLSAAKAYVEQMDRPEEDAREVEGAGIAHGLVQLLKDEVQTSTLRRLAAVTSRLSDSKRISEAEASAGVERLKAPYEATSLTPNEEVRRALLVPPWPHREATILRPGSGTSLTANFAAPNQIAADVWCQVLRQDRPSKAEPPRVHWAVDGGEDYLLRIPTLKAHSYATGTLPAGKHRLEIRLDELSSAQMCSVRFRYLPPDASPTETYLEALQQPAVKSQSRTRWWLVSPSAPTELTVKGGVSLWLEARADMASPAERVRLTAVPQNGGELIETTLELDPTLDELVKPGEPDRPVRVGRRATGVLLLLEDEPYTVRIESDQGFSLARLKARHEKKGRAPPPPQSSHIGVLNPNDELVAPFSTAEFAAGRSIVAATDYDPGAKKFGTVSFELTGGTDDVADADDQRPSVFWGGRVTYRRVLLDPHLWMSFGPEVRMRQNTETAGGGRLSFVAAKIPGGFRMQLTSRILAQPSGFGVRGSYRVDRPFRLTGRTRLIPGLYVAYRHQSIDGEDTELVNGLRVIGTRLLHPAVFTQYVDDHPVVFRPDLRLRWNFFQDQLATVSFNLIPNSDFRSVDQINGGLAWQGLVDSRTRFLPEYLLDYQASYRFEDANRGTAFVRHRVRAGMQWAVYGNDVGRFLIGLQDAIYFSGPFGFRNVLTAMLRYDLLLGRGLQDFSPQAMNFRPFHERRLWAAPE